MYYLIAVSAFAVVLLAGGDLLYPVAYIFNAGSLSWTVRCV